MAFSLLMPIALVNLAGFVWPVLLLFRMSLNRSLPDGGMVETVTADTWRGLITDSFYADIVFRSIWLSFLVTAGALICSYPIALVVHRSQGAVRSALTVLVIVPLLTSAVVRTYGWIAILGDRGLLPALIRAAGFVPPRLIFNTTGVVVGLIEILMPYMILSLLAGFGQLDTRLEKAARSLGAGPLTCPASGCR